MGSAVCVRTVTGVLCLKLNHILRDFYAQNDFWRHAVHFFIQKMKNGAILPENYIQVYKHCCKTVLYKYNNIFQEDL